MSPFENVYISNPALLGTFSLQTTVVLPFPPLPTTYPRHSDVAVVTWVAGQAAYELFSLTGPAMKRYADRVKADLVVLDGFAGQPYALANKFRARQVLVEYGYRSILFVDADALIRDDCVDFFELVPSDHIGMLDETPLYDEWMLAQYHREAAALVQSQGRTLNGAVLPPPRNTGLYYLPAQYADVLTAPAEPFPLCGRAGATVEQTWTSVQVAQSAAPVFELTYPLHHWLWYVDQSERFAEDAMVVHFAGLGESPDVRKRRLRHYAGMGKTNGRPTERVVDGRDLVTDAFYTQMMLDAPAAPALDIRRLRRIGTHRYGWDVATKALTVLASRDGVLFDDFVESSFLWHGDRSVSAGTVPYTREWAGIVHNPPGSPDWPSIAAESITNLSRSRLWLDSLPRCLGLFALTEYLATWVRQEWNVSCEVLRYPTLTPRQGFSWKRFVDSQKTVACIGFWLRRLSSFDHLSADGYVKLRPLPLDRGNAEGMRRLAAYAAEERLDAGSNSGPPRQPALVCDRLSGDEYDDLLSRSIVFLDLIDASGVTTVVECLVRGTPLLVNRIQPVEEYLGSDYPFYFDSLEEAAGKLQSPDLILSAHEHMRANPLAPALRPQAFLDALARTETYARALEASASRRRTGR
jgi:hypothetical protein